MEHRQQVTIAENKTFPQLVPPTKEKLLLYLEIIGVAKLMTQHEKDYFIETAQAYCLNPFKREIHCVPRWSGNKRIFAVITGYDVYIKRAERTGKLDGYGFVTEGKTPALKTVITIYRKDWSHPFEYEVNFDEVVQRKKDGSISLWDKMPKFMLRKVAIAQGFRLCFPDELGGMPYTADELAEGMGIPNAGVEEPETPATKPQLNSVTKGLDLTEEEKARLNKCKTEKALIKECSQLQQDKGPDYRQVIVRYYNLKKGDFK